MEATNGYWVYAVNEHRLDIDGNITGTLSKMLSDGWNLVGRVDGGSPPDDNAITDICRWDGKRFAVSNHYASTSGYWIRSEGPTEITNWR